MTEPELVRVGVFSPSVVLGVAAATGALGRAGLRLEEVAAVSSAHQFADLFAGRLDAVLTSPDNVLAYRTTANPLGQQGDVPILAAIDRGLGLSLLSAPGVEQPGGVLGVDVATSGFALAAYELLAQRGLRAGRDYEVRALGTTPQRCRALVAGECSMTMLNAGSDLRAQAAGCRTIARASSLGPYLGTVLATASVGRTSPAIRRLTDVVVAACGDIVTGGCAGIAATVTAERLALTGEDVERYLRTLIDPVEGLVPDGQVDAASLETLRRLRERHA